MSWSNFDAGNPDMHKVKCDVCLEWFYKKWECIPDIVWKKITTFFKRGVSIIL